MTFSTDDWRALCADERRRWDQAFADAIYKTTTL
jgi:hypothetical protein